MSESLQADVRNGIRKPIITLAVVIAIALGVSAATAVFTVVDGIRRLSAILIYNTQQDQTKSFFADYSMNEDVDVIGNLKQKRRAFRGLPIFN